MEKRRQQTLADYAAIALCPSLIVLLISSLVYFLVLCIYRGGYSGRIGYIWFMFILGTVGIARLSIEKSRSYAFGYAAVLGGATFFVLSRFMQVQGPAAALTPILNGGMIALVWFLADRITFDCTLIDEYEDASDRGLIDGLTDAGATAEQALGQDAAQRAKRRRGHQPGRTVLWLTAAALPIFGLGQFMLPQDSQWQQAAISALAIYLFAALALLVATSFLGVRRYLRQRGVDMPANVSAAWLAGGVGMTITMLLVCFLLPQPGKLLASIELPETISTPAWLKPSQYGWGGEAANPDSANEGAALTPTPEKNASGETPPPAASGQSGEKSSGEGGGQKPGSQAGPGDQGEKSSDEQTSGEQGTGGKDAGGKGAGGKDEASKEQGKGSEPSPDTSSSETEQAKLMPDEKKAGERPADERPADEQNKQEPSGQEDPKKESVTAPEKSAAEKPQASEPDTIEQSDAQQEPPADTSSWLDGFLPKLGSMFRAVIYLVLIGILAAFAWIQRHEIAKAWQAFLAWLEGKKIETDVDNNLASAMRSPPTLRPFASFRNPLGTRIDPREAIIVTYQAAEAWWREKGQARHPQETPFEYSRRLQTGGKADHDAMLRLTDAYNRVVYGDQSVHTNDLHAAATVWKSFSQS